MKFYNLNENLELVFLGDYSQIQDADIDNDDSEQIVIVDFEDLLLWKTDIETIDNQEKNKDFIFELSQHVMFKMVNPIPNEESFDEALESTTSIWVLQGEESFLKIKTQVQKYIQDF